MKNIIFCLLAAIGLLMAACINEDGRVTDVTLDQNNLTMYVGENKTLTATVMPSDAIEKTVYWGSDKPEIATVSNGRVTGISPGITAIIVSTKDNARHAYCMVEVLENRTAQVRFQKLENYLNCIAMAIIEDDENEDESLAYYEFGNSSGISSYYNIPAGNYFPVFWTGSGVCVYCLKISPYTYNFQAKRRYTVVCGNDGTYLTFSVTNDGTF